MVGYLMIRIVADIDWSRPEDAVPAFLTIAGVPLSTLRIAQCLLAP
jgi:AGZA family xanthine/uracil permease-like MFS transporter